MNANKKITATLDSFTSYLRECNMRLTSERMAVVKIVSKHTGLFSVDEIHAEVEKEAFPVALATVYNTIDIMLDAGLLKCMRVPDRSTAFYKLASADSSHIYFICDLCGKIREASVPNLARFIKQYEFQSFVPHTFSLNVHGLCRKCAKKQKSAD